MGHFGSNRQMLCYCCSSNFTLQNLRLSPPKDFRYFFYTGGRSLTMLAKFGPLLSTYLPPELGSFARTCNPSKWEADIWGWHEVMRSAMIHALSLPIVWSHRGNLGVIRCREMATLPAGYIPQRKVPLANSSGSLVFIVCVKCCRMVDSSTSW